MTHDLLNILKTEQETVWGVGCKGQGQEQKGKLGGSQLGDDGSLDQVMPGV